VDIACWDEHYICGTDAARHGAVFQPTLETPHADNEIVWLDMLQNVRTRYDLHNLRSFGADEILLVDNA
jgi:hypothetical protein